MFKQIKLAHRTKKIRKKGLAGRVAVSQLVCESLAREHFVRKRLLLDLKDIFGPELNAVLLIGSSQLGVRKSHRQSDLDVEVYLTKKGSVHLFSSGFLTAENYFMRPTVEKMKYATERALGCGLDISFIPGPPTKSLIQKPFQIIFGRKFVESHVPKERLERNKEFRQKMIDETTKYHSRVE
jgi:hypothetical protein